MLVKLKRLCTASEDCTLTRLFSITSAASYCCLHARLQATASSTQSRAISKYNQYKNYGWLLRMELSSAKRANHTVIKGPQNRGLIYPLSKETDACRSESICFLETLWRPSSLPPEFGVSLARSTASSSGFPRAVCPRFCRCCCFPVCPTRIRRCLLLTRLVCLQGFPSALAPRDFGIPTWKGHGVCRCKIRGLRLPGACQARWMHRQCQVRLLVSVVVQ